MGADYFPITLLFGFNERELRPNSTAYKDIYLNKNLLASWVK